MAKERTKLQKTLIGVFISWAALLLITVVPWIILASIPCTECAYGWSVVMFTVPMLLIDFIGFIVGLVLIIVASVKANKA